MSRRQSPKNLERVLREKGLPVIGVSSEVDVKAMLKAIKRDERDRKRPHNVNLRKGRSA